MDRINEQIEELAHRQLGRFARDQVRELIGKSLGDGLTNDAVHGDAVHGDAGQEARVHEEVARLAARLIRTQLRSGRWRRQSSRVIALPGAPGGWLGDLWTAWLHVGRDSVVSDFAAARLHDLPVPSTYEDSLTVPAGSHRKHPNVTVHQRGDLGLGDVTIIQGLPVTRPPRFLFDVANDVSPARLRSWLDELTLTRGLDPVAVAANIERLSGPGRRAVPSLVELLVERLPSAGLAQGPLERALAQIAVLAGLPEGMAQYPHPGSAGGNQFVDRAWPRARLIVEADGRCWHDRVTAARNDARRDLDAAAAGWQTVRLRHEDLLGDPAITARLLRDTYEARLVEVGGAGLYDSSGQFESREVTGDPQRLRMGA